jgi:hypothetical protein
MELRIVPFCSAFPYPKDILMSALRNPEARDVPNRSQSLSYAIKYFSKIDEAYRGQK